MSRYAVGIDLGTTNCALGYVDLEKARRGGVPHVEVLSVPQAVEVGEPGERPLLPSFCYLPAGPELPPGAMSLPWNDSPDVLVGEAARRQGSRVPGRLVSSAKSWLCHPGVDRTAPILPWQADASDTTLNRLSPVAASSRYLEHLRQAWNHYFPEDRLEDQKVVLTVPASFDEAARELTVGAARNAGLTRLTLLEEPQAAFYRFLNSPGGQGAMAAGRLPVGTTCLVVDCGGGTTDFSLIGLAERAGQPEYERLAVGDHLLLGGDNMDLALARHVELQVSPNRRLDATQWGNLAQQCRRVKEQMLGAEPPATATVTVMARGSRIVGGTLHGTLTESDVRHLVLDGFFPKVGPNDRPTTTVQAGLQEFGLPYVADPAITRHLAGFLADHREAMVQLAAARQPASDLPHAPSAILFNGGVFNAEACQRRLLDVMKEWYGDGWNPTVLPTRSLDLAVAEGAALFAWLIASGGRRIRSGLARSYYLGIASSSDQTPSTDQSVVCVIPHGLQEGESVALDSVPLELQLGQPVGFPLFSSTVRTHDAVGQVFSITPGQLEQLPSLTTVLRGGKRSGNKKIAVYLESRLTEIGTLELSCVAREGENRWRLHFQTRPQPTQPAHQDETPEQSHDSSATAVMTDTFSQEELQEAAAAINRAFGESASARDLEPVNSLVKSLESALGASRSHWSPSLLRALWELLEPHAGGRRVSPDHEARWYNLAGYFLRPGWGHPLDRFKVEQLWKTVHPGVLNSKSDRVWTENWILYRRIAGGLDANRQRELGKRLLPYVQTAGGRKPPRRVGTHELAEIWRALASLEHLAPGQKISLVELAMKQVRKGPAASHFWTAIARLGARTPMQAPANVVVPPAIVEPWIHRLLEIEPTDERSMAERSFALVQLSRLSGDRARDIDDELRLRVVEQLRKVNADADLIAPLERVIALDTAAQGQLLGDSVPPGLQLANSGILAEG